MIQAYNFMLESGPINRRVKYSDNKRSDLKRVYNKIVNLSNRSPFYKINLTKENQEYTIGVKETALALKAKLNETSVLEDFGFQNKRVVVSDERVLSAKLLSQNTENIPEKITFQVNSLATVQVNKGKELLHTSRGLALGEYKFQAKVMDQTYDLTYLQQERTDNLETMKNMVDYLNQSVPGINALVENGNSAHYSHIVITSDMSGRFGDRNISFEDTDMFRESIVDYFGLNRLEKPPTYAQFELNGMEKQTATNAFTLENTLRINLHSTGDQPIILRIVPDSEKILPAVDSVLSSYNNLIGLAKNRTLDNKEHIRATKLINEMKSLEKVYQGELEACGFIAAEDGSLTLEDALAVQAAEDGGMESFFTRENGFIARLLDKAETIAINPMEYLDKTIVTYPNSEKVPIRNPYITSMYSGLFFSSYC
jgi:flagellar hook-associated protein 2